MYFFPCTYRWQQVGEDLPVKGRLLFDR